MLDGINFFGPKYLGQSILGQNSLLWATSVGRCSAVQLSPAMTALTGHSIMEGTLAHHRSMTLC